MPLNEKIIISIILEECNGIQERYNGYRKEMVEAIAHILENERLHRMSATNIQKKIHDKCSLVASILAKHRS